MRQQQRFESLALSRSFRLNTSKSCVGKFIVYTVLYIGLHPVPVIYTLPSHSLNLLFETDYGVLSGGSCTKKQQTTRQILYPTFRPTTVN